VARAERDLVYVSGIQGSVGPIHHRRYLIAWPNSTTIFGRLGKGIPRQGAKAQSEGELILPQISRMGADGTE
jgi:hypothetical protein